MPPAPTAVIFRGDRLAYEFVVLWMKGDEVQAGMALNVPGVIDTLRDLITQRHHVPDERLTDLDISLEDLVPTLASPTSSIGSSAVTKLHLLHANQRQSPWLDNLTRSFAHWAAREASRRRCPWHHLEPDHLRQGDLGLGRLRGSDRHAHRKRSNSNGHLLGSGPR